MSSSSTDTRVAVSMPQMGVSVAEGNAMVNVFNAAGQIAAARECAAGTTVIALAKGMYVVKAGSVTKKVVVE